MHAKFIYIYIYIDYFLNNTLQMITLSKIQILKNQEKKVFISDYFNQKKKEKS